MTDGLLPGADRDLVKPLHKRLEERVRGDLAEHEGRRRWPTRGDAIEVTFEGDVREEGRSGSAACWSPSAGGRTARAWGWRTRRSQVDAQGLRRRSIRQRRTADPHILAIGDVAGEPMLAHKAAHEGKVAVEVLAGEPAAFEPRAIPAVVFTDPEIAWAGLTETEAKQQGRDDAVAQFPWAASGRAQAIGRTEGLTKWLIDPQSDRVLGCGIVGAGAGDLIAEAVLAIEMGAAVRDVADTIHPHPTLSETLGAAAEMYLGTATDLYRPKRKGR